MSLQRLAAAIDRVNRRLVPFLSLCALLLCLVQFSVVMARYIFSIGSIPAQESILYLHGIIFMVGAGYTHLVNGHVRIDVIYRDAKPLTKAWIDLLGNLLLLIPLCIAVGWFSTGYIVNSWAILETSSEGSGLPFVYLFKTVIWVFAALLLLQATAAAIRAWGVLASPPSGSIPSTAP